VGVGRVKIYGTLVNCSEWYPLHQDLSVQTGILVKRESRFLRRVYKVANGGIRVLARGDGEKHLTSFEVNE
jgi:hypothetical protein